MYKEIVADIWDKQFENDIKVITTNGNVKKDSRAVMGKGLALQASLKYFDLDMKLGENILYNGNRVFYYPEYKIITFPTKHNWWENSDLDLIYKSMIQLYNLCCYFNIKKVIFTHVGCNNGGLNWKNVKLKINDILSNNNIEFIIVENYK